MICLKRVDVRLLFFVLFLTSRGGAVAAAALIAVFGVLLTAVPDSTANQRSSASFSSFGLQAEVFRISVLVLVLVTSLNQFIKCADNKI